MSFLVCFLVFGVVTWEKKKKAEENDCFWTRVHFFGF